MNFGCNNEYNAIVFIPTLPAIKMRRQTIILLLILLPGIILGQLYKCDSIYRNENSTIMGGFKNGLKHGAWDYRSDKDFNKVINYEVYWFGELVRADTTNIYHYPMFDIKDSVIEYSFGYTVNFIIEKLIKPESGNYYFCELKVDMTNNTELQFYKKEKAYKEDQVDKLCEMTNRYIILENQKIPIITYYDRRFASLGWTREYEFKVVLDTKNRILEIYK